MAISDYSTTAASNTSISGISLAENVMVPSDVNNALRQMMADIKAGVPYLSGTALLLPGAANTVTWSTTAAGAFVTLTSTDAGATSGPNLELVRNSATPAAVDNLGYINIKGKDSGGNETTYTAIRSAINDATDGTEDGTLNIAAMLAGTLTTYVLVQPSAGSNAVSLPLGQLAFPATANPSSDANTLDDYEEGTWTPTLEFGGGTTGITYSVRTGSYTKIGNQVTLSCQITLSSKGSSTGTATITGAPFSCALVGTAPCQTNSVYSSLTAGLFVVIGATTITIRQPSSVGSGSASDTNFANTSTLQFSLTYLV